MTRKPSTPKTLDVRPREIVRDLLSQTVAATPQRDMTPARERRVATLERQAPTIVHQALQAGVEIVYLGMSPLFTETRLYPGVGSDWTLAPAMNPEDAVVPRRERQALERLAEADLHFPLVYVAHEVDKAKTQSLVPVGETTLNGEQTRDLVGPPPDPVDAIGVGKDLDDVSTRVLGALSRLLLLGGTAALAVVAAPVVAIASLATLDPIILGAIPAVTAEAGEPAAWYVLARWEW